MSKSPKPARLRFAPTAVVSAAEFALELDAAAADALRERVLARDTTLRIPHLRARQQRVAVAQLRGLVGLPPPAKPRAVAGGSVSRRHRLKLGPEVVLRPAPNKRLDLERLLQAEADADAKLDPALRLSLGFWRDVLANLEIDG